MISLTLDVSASSPEELFRKLMQHLGLTQRALAKRLGTDEATVSRWFKPRGLPYSRIPGLVAFFAAELPGIDADALALEANRLFYATRVRNKARTRKAA